MHRTMLSTMIAALLTGSGPALADKAVSHWDRFQLWTQCEKVELTVYIWDAEAKKDVDEKYGLTKKAITAAARGRLRAARLYDEHGVGEVQILADIDESTFTTRLEFRKWMSDPKLGTTAKDRYRLTTWERGGYGTHTKNGQFVLGAISGHIDEFIDEHLRVNNEEACKHGREAEAAREEKAKKESVDGLLRALALAHVEQLYRRLGTRVAAAKASGAGLTLTAEEVAKVAGALAVAPSARKQ